MEGAVGAAIPDESAREALYTSNPIPKYSDETSWPADFLSQETVIGYKADRRPQMMVSTTF